MRSSGILMHISSLPSKYGIGTLGKQAYEFVDFLKRAKQTYWQVLPINPTSYGDSPYQSPSAFAGNPYFIDLDMLCEDGLLKQSEISNYYFGDDSCGIDYARLFESRYPLLRTAFSRYEKDSQYESFVEENKFWLDDYALYMSVKEDNHYKSWLYWDDDIRLRQAEAVENYRRKMSRNIEFYKFIQYLFFCQWDKLKNYANQNGIFIIGDMPIYVALDSAEVWTESELFLLDENRMPKKVAGCPPDAFSPTGQLWGNPIYDWNKMKKDGYEWWIKRIDMATKLYDRVRIDHFRGFESYYAIPYGETTAVLGTWEKGPGIELFDAIRDSLGDVSIIAEDLGFLTPEVHKLLAQTGYPGMKVLQFAFDPYGDSDYLPHNYIKNCVAYTGTHDNNTAVGWYDEADRASVKYAGEYLHADRRADFADAFIRAVMSSVADTVIIPIQDFLGLNSKARMNTPSTIGKNWMFRVPDKVLTDVLADRIAYVTHIYRRG
ncbi:MAG: 4-alpha-glucanotransferase [Clostridia bacterium]|nr:4-alpha-glucanotransferase [Clostridia bacterium]